MPAAGVQLRQVVPRLIPAHAVAVGGAVQRRVMHQKNHAVAAEFGVAFEHAVTVLRAQTEGGQGVFGRQFACAAVRDPAGVRPVG